MKRGHVFAIGLLSLSLVACGGNGGDNDDSSEPGRLTNTRIEATLVNVPAVNLATGLPESSYQDILNLVEGDEIQFQLVQLDGSGNRTVIGNTDTVTYAIQGNTALQNSLTPYGRLAIPRDSSIRTPQTVTAIYNGIAYGDSFQIASPRNNVRLRGHVYAANSTTPVYRALVRFYSVNNTTGASTQIANVRTAIDGSFRVSVPTTSASDSATTAEQINAVEKVYFEIGTPVPSGYGTTYTFRGVSYSSGSTSRPQLVTNTPSSDDSSVFQPYRSGDRFLADDNGDGSFTELPIFLSRN
jgi:hypothetical protein